MTEKEKKVFERIQDMKFACNGYINSGKGNDIQITVWKDRREILDIILKIMEYELNL